jgi:hypothetical protein
MECSLSGSLQNVCFYVDSELFKMATTVTVFTVTHLYSFISGVMISMLASNAVDCEFKPWSGQTKDNKIGICCFADMQHAILGKPVPDVKKNRAYREVRKII